MYGFSMRVKSGIGLSNPPPQPDDTPESYIVVDRVAPEVSLLPISQGAGEQHNEVVIEWSMRDELLADSPVSLFYSTSRDGGDWEPMTGWMANSGRYQWAVSPQFRKSVFIRLDARDAAGNVTSLVSEEPVVLDRSRPQARITDVETIRP
jgi:roadblock/LC7 domain-containing protein